MPPQHAVTRALRDAAVAQTDAAYLTALARGAHDAVGHTAESAPAFIAEVAARRQLSGGSVEELLAFARGAAKHHRDIAADLLQATRFGPPAAPRTAAR
jgi:hypothetical protein